jgi:hypothetical protein
MSDNTDPTDLTAPEELEATRAELEHWRAETWAARKERDSYRAEEGDSLRWGRDGYLTTWKDAVKERDELRAELSLISAGVDACEESRRQLSCELETAKDKLARIRRPTQIDGDVLAEIIAAQCPLWMATHAARDLAESAVRELTRRGMFVFRGDNGDPWTPHSAADDEVVDATIWGDEWIEYGVFHGDECLFDDLFDQSKAQSLADRVPGACVKHRRVLSEDWETQH